MSEMERPKNAPIAVPIHSEERKIMLSLYFGFMIMLKPIWTVKTYLKERKAIKNDS